MAKKPISTQLSRANIDTVMALLAATAPALNAVSQRMTPDSQRQPWKAGERSFVEVVAHVLNCEERLTESIYAALLVHEPLVLDIHPERQWGALLRYETCDCSELLAYFSFRRKVLLRVLSGLSDAQWSRVICETGKQRKESVYWRARTMALHEAEHVTEVEDWLKNMAL
ncbi:MAG: DinB family protein [Chloroflexota bacterium]|nr:DinB family protein [Chloroflexota bacterium]